MASPRSALSVSFTSRPSMRISPAVASSSPAMVRRSVDLPQPEGPTKTANSPSSILRSIGRSTWTGPKDLDRRLRVRSAKGRLLEVSP